MKWIDNEDQEFKNLFNASINYIEKNNIHQNINVWRWKRFFIKNIFRKL
jgi:hypothetical protein